MTETVTAQEIRQKYLEFFEQRGHAVIPRAPLVLYNDPTTLFTSAGMQPLLPYLLGEAHPEGKRIVDSQTCLRSQDIEEVGDNRHTTFFEMLGNWSLGDYFKKEEIGWLFEFLTDVVGLDPQKARRPMATKKVCKTAGYSITKEKRTGGAAVAMKQARLWAIPLDLTLRFFMILDCPTMKSMANTAIPTATVVALSK
jgi:hypothetical protein